MRIFKSPTAQGQMPSKDLWSNAPRAWGTVPAACQPLHSLPEGEVISRLLVVYSVWDRRRNLRVCGLLQSLPGELTCLRPARSFAPCVFDRHVEFTLFVTKGWIQRKAILSCKCPQFSLSEGKRIMLARAWAHTHACLRANVHRHTHMHIQA